ncbi:DHHA1 domain-containing protein [Mesobacillus subterraneus]|uniref:alanyl-tRNA editing protein n=1 Tax=Mesobacillus subterraneus TaxID=285983 RepID=UPI001CFD5A8A|nr:DHHA1 domain-containing protein [Mesobacillus subterraneus]WLR53733.1 DHHA1 domain-containing protein [Mesobacillus subterraneus]
MESKLYYQDAYIKKFAAELITQKEDESGRLYAILSQTAFYPTGGGQRFDTGFLNGVEVVDVDEVEGEIRHYLKEGLMEAIHVEGEIDWERRFDHMQQHAGQHILSASFEDLFGYKTVSFHLGQETLTIDLETENLSADEVAKAEELANQVIIENRPIVTKWVDEEELKQYRLRKELAVSNNIRLVIIPDFDYNGCGGTHPNSTAEVGALKILGWERQKKMVRVEFVCGKRVLNKLGQKHEVIEELTALLNSPEQHMRSSVTRLLSQKKELEKTVEVMKEQLLRFEVNDIIGSGKNNIVSSVFKNRSIQELQKLARLLVSAAEDKIYLLASENEEKLQFVFAKGKNTEVDLKGFLQRAISIIDGKGGGTEFLVQGGGKWISGEEFIHKVSKIIQ